MKQSREPRLFAFPRPLNCKLAYPDSEEKECHAPITALKVPSLGDSSALLLLPETFTAGLWGEHTGNEYVQVSSLLGVLQEFS